jgi:hypothetical protein
MTATRCNRLAQAGVRKHLQLRSAYRAQRQAPLPLRFAPNVSVRVAFVRNN